MVGHTESALSVAIVAIAFLVVVKVEIEEHGHDLFS